MFHPNERGTPDVATLTSKRASTSPAPKNLEREQLERMMPACFSSEEDAVYGAALVIRGGQYPWLIEGPGVRIDAMEIGRRCEPILQVLRR